MKVEPPKAVPTRPPSARAAAVAAGGYAAAAEGGILNQLIERESRERGGRGGGRGGGGNSDVGQPRDRSFIANLSQRRAFVTEVGALNPRNLGSQQASRPQLRYQPLLLTRLLLTKLLLTRRVAANFGPC